MLENAIAYYGFTMWLQDGVTDGDGLRCFTDKVIAAEWMYRAYHFDMYHLYHFQMYHMPQLNQCQLKAASGGLL